MSFRLQRSRPKIWFLVDLIPRPLFPLLCPEIPSAYYCFDYPKSTPIFFFSCGIQKSKGAKTLGKKKNYNNVSFHFPLRKHFMLSFTHFQSTVLFMVALSLVLFYFIFLLSESPSPWLYASWGKRSSLWHLQFLSMADSKAWPLADTRILSAPYYVITL